MFYVSWMCTLFVLSLYKVGVHGENLLEATWNAMAHARKLDFVFLRNGRVHLNRRGRQFSQLLAAEVCATAVVMLDTPCYEVVWRVLVTYSIRQFPLYFHSRASPCAITFQLESTKLAVVCYSLTLPWGMLTVREDDTWLYSMTLEYPGTWPISLLWYQSHLFVFGIERRIKVTARRGRGLMHLLDDLKKLEDTGNWKEKH